MLLVNGAMVIQTYFAIGGFLHANRLQKASDDDEKIKAEHVIIAILYRLMR